MVKNKKLNLSLIILLVICFVASMALFVGSVMPTGYATGVQQAATQDFRVEQGASVRTNPDKSGIRFTTYISNEYYNGINNGANTNIEWHTLIGYGVENVADITLENMASNTNIKEFVPEGGGTLQPVASRGGYVYQTVLYFDLSDKTEQDIAKAFNQKINVRSYVKYNDGTDKIVYTSDASDNYRSISEVAEKVLIKDAATDNFYNLEEMATQKGILQNYITASQKPIIYSVIGYAEDMYKANDKTLSGLVVADGVYNAKLNGKNLGSVTVANGATSIPASVFPEGLTLGENYSLTLTGDKAHVQNVKYVSKVINDQTEFVDMVKFYKVSSDTDSDLGNTSKIMLNTNEYASNNYYDGTSFTQRYYVLAEDLTLTSNMSWADGNLYTLYDIFDGQGNKILGGTNVGLYGVIPRLGIGAKVQNLGIDIEYFNTQHSNQRCAFWRIFKGTIDNVAIYIKDKTPNKNDYNNKIIHQGWVVTINNLYVYTNTISQMDASTCGIGNIYGSPNVITNLVAISQMTKVVNGLDAKNIDTTSGYDGALRYATISDKPTTLTHVGNWKINDTDGTATWDTTTVDPVAPPVADDCTDFFNKIEYVKTAYAEDMYKANAKTLLGLAVANGTYAIELNGASLGELAVENGVATVPASVFPQDLTLGEYYVVNLTKDSTVYTQIIRYVSGIIDNQQEFVDMVKFYKVTDGHESSLRNKENVVFNQGTSHYDGESFTQRYYVLTQDLTFTEDLDWGTKDKTADQGDSNKGSLDAFWDVFDGQGYKLLLGQHVAIYGVIPRVGEDAKVINLGMELDMSNQTVYEESRKNIFYMVTSATIENISVFLNSTKNQNYFALTCHYLSDSVFRNVYIHVSEIVSQNAIYATYISRSIYGVNTIENVLAITKLKNGSTASSNADPHNKICAINDTVDNLTPTEGVLRYDNLAAKNADTTYGGADITHVGAWKINADGTASWDEDVKFDIKLDKSALTVGGKAKAVVFNNASVFKGLIKVVSSNESIIKVNEDNTVEGVTAGTAEVTVAYQIGGQTYSKTITITVA